ncbi:hypothetical protein CV023_15940 [Brevibacterium sp. CCUG 69071]|nr:hypothetical protein [Brevibacterium sp. CCUG 69071]
MSLVEGQLSIFDELAELEGAKAPAWSPAEIDGECDHCGALVSSRNPMDRVNHGRMDGTCTSRALSRIHALTSLRSLDPAQRREAHRCMKHQGKKKPCTQECLQQQYEKDAARATEAWGGDEWRNS